MNTTQHSTIRRHRVATGMAATTVLAVLAVAGCSSEDVAERLIEEGVQRESGENVDIDLDDGNIRIETDEGVVEMTNDGEGNISIQGEGTDGDFSIDSEDGQTVIQSDDGSAVISQGGTDIPDDFPGSVPLPDGFQPEFSQSVTSDQGTGWVLGGPIGMSAADVADSYFGALEAAGFERLSVTETPDSVIFGFDNGEYTISGLAGDDGSGETYFNVTVAESQS